MPLYTFYPCRLDDASLAFESYELQDDDQAAIRGDVILTQHPSAAFVVVWSGDRKVCSVDRARSALTGSEDGDQPST